MGFDSILIANRGEIAVRVTRTARRLGYRTVAVYSSPDEGAPHARAADLAVHIGGAGASESYLDGAKLVDAARRSGAGAIHPGYGFLSENAAFARACEEAGVVFIGPPASAIELMGSKRVAKRAMREAGVRCVPGFDGDDPSDEELCAAAKEVGFPLLVKAAAGGGGRGMRLVADPRSLREAIASARAEATSAFGSGELLLEKALQGPRHVEVQILADAHGKVLHLGERDCSVQRRHQKIVEECPSPAVGPELRAEMGAVAVRAAAAAGYVGAGTVEMLLDEHGFYFLEMNTRLQVEHPVTELCTGLDLVEWQLRVASGEAIDFEQADVRLAGHAIEARLYAEDPARGFMPRTGTVTRWRAAAVRVDHAVQEGVAVSAHYDPMIAKVIAHGTSRDEARRKLVSALADTTLFGVVSNKSFLGRVCAHPDFAAGRATTGFVEQHLEGLIQPPPGMMELSLAALVVVLESARGLCEDESWIGWHNASPLWSAVDLADGHDQHSLRVRRAGRGFCVRRGDEEIAFDRAALEGEALRVEHGGVERTVRCQLVAGEVWLDDGSNVRVLRDVTHAPAETEDARGSGLVVAPLDGAVREVRVAVGQAVARGEVLCVVEAMKMEHRIAADAAGTVARVLASVGEQVKTRQLLLEIAVAEEE